MHKVDARCSSIFAWDTCTGKENNKQTKRPNTKTQRRTVVQRSQLGLIQSVSSWYKALWFSAPSLLSAC